MDVTEAVLIAVGTGLVSSVATVIAMRTDITWLKLGMAELKKATHRAHQRIDELEKELIHQKTRP